MANITIELRPPPNVDFVHGFPGIPPSGPERPQAAVKGAIEVRVPPTGVKARWVRIELRKVEVLPPGGEPNTYWDCIGPSPINLWSASDEYGILRTQDFPFSIRIPESIPPSVELDNRAFIGYELVASVCTKGKRGFLRKAKSVVSTSKAPITIDKHELHSTWPVYNQPEIRHMMQDGISLMVERSHTCFGPGDRVAVAVTLKSDSLHTVILRAFEIALKETTVLRAGPHGARRTQPLSKTVVIAENRVILDATMYGGQQKQAELSCTLSPKHTTPTLNAARHIDVTYTLMVKAVMGTGNNLFMDLPVIISNWQRDISSSAIAQIGPTPPLSHLPMTPASGQIPQSQAFSNPAHTGNTAAARVQASTLPVGRTSPEDRMGQGRQPSAGISKFGTANPPGGNSAFSDEFGFIKPTPATPTKPAAGGAAQSSLRPVISPINTGSGASPRPTSRGSGNPANRLTIMNAEPSELHSEENVGGSSRPQPQQQQQWPSAEREKEQLYERAIRRVGTNQPHIAQPPRRTTPPPSAVNSGPLGGPSAPHNASTPKASWPDAKDEKRRLFEEAQAAVARSHAGAVGTPPGPTRNGSSDYATGASSPPKSTGQELYQRAMDSVKYQGPTPQSNGHAVPAAGPTSSGFKSGPSAPVYPTAELEKAALRRYEEAKLAVDRVHANIDTSTSSAGRDSAGPIAYEALFPNSSGAGGAAPSVATPVAAAAALTSPGGGAEAPPPPFGPIPAAGPAAILSEKERLRREYEARDAAEQKLRQQQQLHRNDSYGPPPPSFSAAPPPPFTPSAPAPTQFASAIAEKEAMRRKFEAQDRAAAAALPPPAPLQTPSRNNSAMVPPYKPARNASYTSPLSPSRPTPVTPSSPSYPAANGGSSKVLTAAEEKALLRAKYDAQEAAPSPLQPRMNGLNARPSPSPPPPAFSSSALGANGGIGVPPPLMPRPPVEYIQETQEEDARLSRLAENGSVSPLPMNGYANGIGKPYAKFNGEYEDGA